MIERWRVVEIRDLAAGLVEICDLALGLGADLDAGERWAAYFPENCLPPPGKSRAEVVLEWEAKHGIK